MRFWGGPTGTATSSETALGDPLLIHGFGIGFGTSPVTRPRPWLLVRHTTEEYTADGPVIFGDSGGPVLHAESGEALGVVSRLNLFESFPSTTVIGPTFESILARLASAGFAVSIRTAPFSFPPTP